MKRPQQVNHPEHLSKQTNKMLLGVLFALGILAYPSGISFNAEALAQRPKRKPVLVSRWVKRNDNGMIYFTTNDPKALQQATAKSGKILKYRNGKYVHAIHKQYPSSCGPASLAIVLKQLGITDPPGSKAYRPWDVDLIRPTLRIPVGFFGSEEDLLWLGLHRKRLEPGQSKWNGGHKKTDSKYFMDTEGRLDLRSSGVAKTKLSEGSNMNYLPYSKFPRWLWRHPGVGYGGKKSYSTGLPGIMNYILSGKRNGPWRDAMPLEFQGRNYKEVVAYRRIIKGFIDHNISLVCGVDKGGHFNVIIGYSGAVSPASRPFYVYTADPLDGWGRSPKTRQPLRWRRISLVAGNLRRGKGVLTGIICWNHHGSGGKSVRFRASRWAYSVDRANGNAWLTGKARQPEPRDPLHDPLAIALERMPLGPPIRPGKK